MNQWIGSTGDGVFSVDEWTRYGDELRRPLMLAEGLTKANTVMVVGAGLSGLCVAYRLAMKRPDVQIELLEKSDRCGGTIETWNQGEWMCDVAVNATRAHPSFWRLIDDLGLQTKFKPSNPAASTRWIHTGGRRRKLSPWLVLQQGLFKVIGGVRSSRQGQKSVAEAIPIPTVADAMTLGIVNDVSRNVDADFLMPSMTRFGDEPPIKWSKVKRKMMQNYPLFTPQKGTTASLNGGMQTLVDALVSALEALDNVQISFGVDITTPEALAEEQQQPLSSIVWCAPLRRKTTEFSHLNVYAVGFTEEDSRSVPVGYGTLIPDPEAPISGVLHESDVHASPRAPKGHRLFRLMSPVARGATEEDVKRSLRTYLCEADPVVFEKIGERRIPSYAPGYMASLEVSNPTFTRAGWFYSGVSITHVVAEAERIADVF